MPTINSVFVFLILCLINLASCGYTDDNKNGELQKTKTASQILGNPDYPAICYGGYRTNTRDSQPTIAQIKEDLKIIHALGFKILRTYNTRLPEAGNILKAITELRKNDSTFEMYVMLGAWIDCKNAWTKNQPDHTKENEKANAEEISVAAELANAYPEIIKVISVGNEARVKWATNYYVTPEIILKWVNYLQKLKKEKQLPGDLWITSSDNFASWGGGDTSYHTQALKDLCRAVDYISIHTYPMHDTHYNPAFWGIEKDEEVLTPAAKIDSLMARSLNYAKNQYLRVKDYMKSIGVNKPVHIGETGWASSSDGFYGLTGSKACDEYKSAVYYHKMQEWTNTEKITCFYFEAFDEKWKDPNNAKGSENHFGLFTVDGKAKFVIWDKVDAGILNGLKRDGKAILKTFNGDEKTLMKTVAMPSNMNK